MQKSRPTIILFFFAVISWVAFPASGISGEVTFTLMNYNIKGLPLPWLKHKSRYQRIGKAINSLKESNLYPDVINLEEAMQKNTEEITKALSLPYYAFGPRKKGLRESSGLKTMSRYEIVQVKERVFDRCASYDCFARKGVLMTTIRIPGLPTLIDIYATHLQADPTGDPFTSEATTTEIKEYQTAKMSDFIFETHNPAHLLFIVGDFNFRQSDDMYWFFVNYLNVKQSTQECALVYNCAGASDPEKDWETMIDHQFYAPLNAHGVTVTPFYFDRHFNDPTGGKQLSDHRATLLQYKIRFESK